MFVFTGPNAKTTSRITRSSMSIFSEKEFTTHFFYNSYNLHFFFINLFSVFIRKVEKKRKIKKKEEMQPHEINTHINNAPTSSWKMWRKNVRGATSDDVAKQSK